MNYVDGFVLPVPKKNLAAYRRMAHKAGKIWREHGAIEFRECVGDDLAVKMGVPFARLSRLKPGETVMFSWIVYKARAPRPRQQEGDERPADGQGDGADAVRRQTHGLRRLPYPGRPLAGC